MAINDKPSAEELHSETMAECVTRTRDLAALESKAAEVRHELACLEHQIEQDRGMLQNARNRLERYAEQLISVRAGV